MPAVSVRLLPLLLIGLPVLFLGPGCRGERPTSPAGPSTPILIETDGALEYTFHVVTGGEALFDLERDPRRLSNLLQRRPALALHLRECLERRLGVPDIESLIDPDDPRRKALENMGYL
jgi:hypothetical protein